MKKRIFLFCVLLCVMCFSISVNANNFTDSEIEDMLAEVYTDSDYDAYLDDNGNIHLDTSFLKNDDIQSKDDIVEKYVLDDVMNPIMNEPFYGIIDVYVKLCEKTYNTFSSLNRMVILNVYEDASDKTSDLICSIVNGQITYCCYVTK